MTATLAANAWKEWKAIVDDKPPESLFQRLRENNERTWMPDVQYCKSSRIAELHARNRLRTLRTCPWGWRKGLSRMLEGANEGCDDLQNAKRGETSVTVNCEEGRSCEH